MNNKTLYGTLKSERDFLVSPPNSGGYKLHVKSKPFDVRNGGELWKTLIVAELNL